MTIRRLFLEEGQEPFTPPNCKIIHKCVAGLVIEELDAKPYDPFGDADDQIEWEEARQEELPEIEAELWNLLYQEYGEVTINLRIYDGTIICKKNTFYSLDNEMETVEENYKVVKTLLQKGYKIDKVDSYAEYRERGLLLGSDETEEFSCVKVELKYFDI